MATVLMLCEEIERSFKRQRVFLDRTMQPDALADAELFARYRMPRQAIMTLVELVRPQLERPTQRSNPLSPETQVLLTLRYLGKGGFLSEIGDLHGVSEASVSRAFHNTVRAINEKLNNISFQWIKEEQERTKIGFNAISGFPKVLGSVDGTLIPIKRPSLNEEMAFVCRKGYRAINVQGVCDFELRFTNEVVRWPGSTHDFLILTSSGLGKKLETGLLDGWLLGDSGYACRPWLLTPIVEPRNRPEERYNSSHARTRNTVERAFGVLKSRFRCLHKSSGCLWFAPDKCSAIIMAAFKLHNFCADNHCAEPPAVADREDDPPNLYNGAINDGTLNNAYKIKIHNS